MNTQLTKKIFIASSSEMHHERLVLVDLLTDLSTEKVYYQPVKWEYVDTALRVERKEDQYLRRLRDCDVCITMFSKTLGKYTVEEFKDAINEQKAGNNLKKVLVLVKNDGADADENLKGFLCNIKQEYGCTPVSFDDDTQLKEEVVKFLSNVEGRSDAVQPIRDINVMVAGLNELEEDKLEFTDIMAHLNEALIKTGIRLRRVKCSDRMAEFKKQISDCDMCLNVYWHKLPECAKDNVDYAYTSLKAGNNPKHLYIFFKETDKDVADKALSEFKASFETEYGHFFCRYENVDTMNLNFVLQLMMMQNVLDNRLINHNGGSLFVGNVPIVNVGNIPFAKLNKDYQRMNKRLLELPEEIEDARIDVKTYHNDPRREQRLQKLLDEYNSLQKEFDQHQQFLFDVAMRVAQLQGKRFTARMKRAIKAFEVGDVERANIILDEALEDAKRLLGNFIESREITELMRQDIFSAIEELLLTISTIMADSKQPIEGRISRVKQIYSQVDEMAGRVSLDNRSYSKLLGEYAMFLYLYGACEQDNIKALGLFSKQRQLLRRIHGEKTLSMADSYERSGLLYVNMKRYNRALRLYKLSYDIRREQLGDEHPDTAKYFNNIGHLYHKRGEKGDYEKAIANYEKALKIWEKDNANIDYLSTIYSNMAILDFDYNEYNNFDKAWGLLAESVGRCELQLGKEHQTTADVHIALGYYLAKHDYDKSLIHFFKALTIMTKNLGVGHCSTVSLIYNIGRVFEFKCFYREALAFYNKVLEIETRRNESSVNHHNKLESIQNDIARVELMGDETLGTNEKFSFYDWEKISDELVNNEDGLYNEINDVLGIKM
ncbi:MAG: tetratricopeptide repeat protein [Bacteroidales bacterium]|nr:tetratricopeptide repeat protein [Bacteroidales bacterium]